jgi:hypothetical protein
MTAQIPDSISIDGAEHMLFAEPLEAYYSQLARPSFAPTSTANWRGYVASWEIRDNRMYLSGIKAELCDRGGPQGWRCDKRQPVGLKELFPGGKGEKVFAEWFSGTLRVPLGAQMEYVHMGYESVYEFDLLIVVEKGMVKSTRTIDNRKAPR